MQGLSCPRCGTTQIRCRPAVTGSPFQWAPAWLLHTGTAIGVSVCALAAICVNLFMLDAGNIDPAMFWTQVTVAVFLALLAWVGAWQGSRARMRGLQCRCLLCGAQWKQQVKDTGG